VASQQTKEVTKMLCFHQKTKERGDTQKLALAKKRLWFRFFK
jgi:hypothetical protein